MMHPIKFVNIKFNESCILKYYKGELKVMPPVLFVLCLGKPKEIVCANMQENRASYAPFIYDGNSQAVLNPSEGSLRRKYWPCFGEQLYSQRPRKTCEIMVLQKQPFHNPPVHNMHICNMGRQPGKLALDLFILSPTLSISWWKTSQ